MTFPIDKILRESSQVEKYNILTGITHEGFESSLCKTGHNFYAFPHQSFKQKWNEQYRPIPDNYHILSSQKLPIDLEFDFILSQNKFGQFDVFSILSEQYNLPIISLEHTLVMKEWSEQRKERCRRQRGIINVFISDYSVDKWGFDRVDPTVRVVNHGIDTNLFCPDDSPKDGLIFSCVNDFINRDYFCNFQGWQRTIQGLPYKILGDTPGLSRPTANVNELIKAYRECSIFYNTSTVSPVPSVLMESMACGAAVVSTATCMIPEIIQHGYNGLMSNDEKELRSYLELLLNNPGLAKELGQNARKTIVERYNLQKSVDNWNLIFDEAYGTIYRGPQ